MSTAALLIARNLRLFFRDRAGVFFSLLAPLILIGLYVLFLGSIQVDALTAQFPGADEAEISHFVDSWVFSGIVAITTLTTALAAVAVFVDDRSTGRFADFIVAPARRWQLVLGYLGASFLISLVLTGVILVAGQLVLVALGAPAPSVGAAIATVATVALSCAAYAALASFVATFLATSGAFAALSTVVGTVIGFLASCYIPAGTLPDGVVNTINALPFAQAAMLVRLPLTAQPLSMLTDGQPQARSAIERFYGIEASVGDVQITPALAAGVLAGILVAFAALATWRLARTIR